MDYCSSLRLSWDAQIIARLIVRCGAVRRHCGTLPQPSADPQATRLFFLGSSSNASKRTPTITAVMAIATLRTPGEGHKHVAHNQEDDVRRAELQPYPLFHLSRRAAQTGTDSSRRADQQ